MSLRRALGEDDTGPLLTLGDRVVWLFEHGPEHGWVRWIGRIPVVSPNWAVGVEFDNPIGAGDGKFGGKRYFYARNDHAYFLPNSSLLRAADYNSSFRKENAMATPGHQAKMYTFPHRYSAAKCPFPGPANAGEGGHVTEVHLISSGNDGRPHGVCGSSKLHRSQSTRLQGPPNLSDYDNWLGSRDPCNVHVKSWKSSSTHSVVSCPPVLLPKMLVARELTSSSDSEVNFGGTLRSLMSCFTLGSHRRKKRRKKKKKSHRLVIATGPNHSNYCYSSENAAATQARQLVCEKERDSQCASQDLNSVKVRVSAGPKAMWRYSLQEQDLPPKRDLPSKEAVARHTTEQKGPPKLPPKTSSKKKRLAPQPPDGTTTPTGSLPRARPAGGPGSSSAHSTESLSLTRRKSHKKPAPQPPARDAWRSVTRGATLPTAKQMGVYANESVEHSKGTTTLKGHTFSVGGVLEMSSGSLVHSYSLKSQQAQEKQEFGINLVNMVIKPDLPVKTIPVSKTATISEKAEVVECGGSTEDKEIGIRHVAKTPDGTGKPALGRTAGVSGGEKRDALKYPTADREARSSTLPSTRQCPPILEEEEPYASTTMGGEPNNLESVLKRNSNVFELLDAFSKLELNSEEVQEDSQPESPKQQRKQAKSLKSLFQKHPTDASKVVSTKWTYTPMEAKKENVFGAAKPTSASPARHENSGEVDHKVGNINDPSPSGSSEAQFAKKPQPPLSLDTPLASCRMNLKPVSHSPDFGSVLCKLRPQATDSSSENPPWKRQLEALKMTANKAGPSGAPELPEAENSTSGGRKDGWGNPAGENAASCVAVVAASSPEMMAGRASPSPAASARSSARTSPGRQRPPMHPNSPTALMQAKLPALFRQLEEAISKGEHDRAAILARELAMYKVSCSLRRVRKVADPKQFTVKMYVEDKKSHVGPISLPVHPEMTLSNLKRKIETEYNFPVRVQRWILGKNLATDDGATLEQYGVSHSACPVFLYLVSPAEELKADEVLQTRRWKPPGSIASTEEGTEELALAVGGRQAPSEASSTLDALLNDHVAGWTCQLCGINNTEPDTCAMCGVAMVTDGVNHSGGNVDHHPPEDAGAWAEPVHGGRLELDQVHLLQDDQPEIDGSLTNVDTPPTQEDGGVPEEKESFPPPRTAVSPQDYSRLVELEEQDLVPSMEAFECSVCFLDVEPGRGVLLRDCLHMFCRDCLSNSVRYAEEAMVKCPFRNDEYSCSSHLQEREIRALVSVEVYEHHLSRSVKTAESQAPNSFHCQTADCPGWCMLEDNVNMFQCPVCGHANCLTCRAIHEGKNCLQYQDELDFNAPDGHEARQTKEYLDNMVKEGQAMHCPQCRVIVMKKWGCDWLKCSVCQTEICWVTKGPRWGPQGKGDTSAGCKCGVNGVKCHPKCNYCH